MSQDEMRLKQIEKGLNIMTATGSSHELGEFNDLYLEQLRDLYSAENQIIKALPKMVAAATEPKLKEGFQMHLEQTKEHATRLEEIFTKIGVSPDGTTCKAMNGLIAEGDEALKEGKPGPVLDAALIAGAQRIEHYEIAAYGTVKTFAKQR
jgi:ferritin-like metal-binding protein YciE